MNASTADQPEIVKIPYEAPQAGPELAPKPPQTPALPPEYGGRKSGLEPTRYGDWEKDGRCIDF